jgi:hypothetical protein
VDGSPLATEVGKRDEVACAALLTLGKDLHGITLHCVGDLPALYARGVGVTREATAGNLYGASRTRRAPVSSA